MLAGVGSQPAAAGDGWCLPRSPARCPVADRHRAAGQLRTLGQSSDHLLSVMA